MRLYYPQNIDLAKLEEQTVGLPFDQVLYVLDLICRKQVNKRKDELSRHGWVRLSSAVLSENRIRYFSRIRKALLELGIIENLPFAEGKARSFRFTKGYRVELDFIQAPDNPFWRQVERRKKEYFKKMARKYPIAKYFNEKLTIDEEAALEWILNDYKERLEYDKENAWHASVSNVLAMDAIIYGDYHIKVDDYGRLHTNLTNLSKGLRRFLRYDGEPLAELDFVNSQPMLLSYLLEPQFWDRSAEINYKSLKGLKYEDYRYWKPTISRWPSWKTNYTMDELLVKWQTSLSADEKWLKFRQLGYPSISRFQGVYCSYYLTLTHSELSLYSTEIQRYKNTTREGLFYEEMAEQIGEGYTRDDIKPMMYEVLFGQPTTNRKRLSKNKRIFLRTYPTVQKLIDLIKTSGHEKLAHVLQSVESKLVFEHIVPTLQNEFNGEALFTIHDSFLFPERMKSEYERLILAVAKEQLGFEPKLK